MADNVVGSASVTIEADLSHFGEDARHRMEEQLHGLAPTINQGLNQAGGGAGEAGGHAGTRAGEGFNQGMQGQVQHGLGGLRSRLTSGLGGLAKVAAGAFAVDKIGSFFTDSVQGWQDHQRILQQTAAVIKSTGAAAALTQGQFDDLSSKIEANTGVDGDNILEGENMLATFTNIKDGVGAGNDIFSQATSIMTDMSVAMGTDVKGQAISLGKALNDPIAGVGALSRVGVTFTEQQKKTIASMVKLGNTAGAQRIILGELKKEFGGSAAAQETSSQKMAVAFHALQDSVGQALTPIIEHLAHFLTRYVIPAFTAVVGWLQRNASTIKTVALVLAPLIALWAGYVVQQKAAAFITAFQAGQTKLNTIATVAHAIAVNAVSLATKVWTGIQAAFNLVMAANPIVLVVLAIAALVAAVVLAYNKVGWFRDLVQGAWHVIATAAQWAWDHVLKPVFDAFKAVAEFLWDHVLKPIFTAIKLQWQVMGTIFRAVWNDFLEPVFSIFKRVALFLWHNVVEPVATGIGNAFHDIGHAAKWVWDHTVGWVFGKIKDGIREVSRVVHLVIGWISGAFRHIGDGLEWAWDHTVGYVFGLIKDALQEIKDAYNWLFGAGDKTKSPYYGAGNGYVPTGTPIPTPTQLGGDYSKIPDLGNLSGLLPPAPKHHHAKGGMLSGGVDVIGEEGQELLLRGRMVVSNPRTSGGNFGEFANAIADKLGSNRMHPDDIDALGSVIADAVMRRPLKIGEVEIARAANNGNLRLGRR